MAVYSSNMVRFCKAFASYRGMLLPRVCMQQPAAGVKQKTVEEKLGIPSPPKKPMTPFFRFLTLIRPTIKQKNPEAKITDVTKLAAEQWEKADPEVRQKLHDEYKDAMRDYLEERLKYEMSLTPEQKEEIQQAKEDIVDAKERKKLRKKMKELGKPKKPPTGFITFFTERLSSRGDMSFREFQLKVGKEWENLPEEKKQKYQIESKQAMEIYKREVQSWEEKMIRLGHIDVVRNEALIEPKTRPRSRTQDAAKVDE
ncbi:transcription factor A, mitochondrial [Anabrus simplex]|uniref:transcription factor A, mitochondrial n=1 Tax=Anabrus simplex TaxID=316456 RepID=UPI0035A263D7